jgi:hypothetical protein
LMPASPGRPSSKHSSISSHSGHHYWFYGCIGDLQYCFEFAINHDRYNLLSTGVLQGRLLIYIEQVPRTRPPPSIDNWMMIRHEDMPSRERGGDVAHLIGTPTLGLVSRREPRT